MWDTTANGILLLLLVVTIICSGTTNAFSLPHHNANVGHASVSASTTRLYAHSNYNNDEDDDDDDIMIDPDSLGDWRAFRKNLAATTTPSGSTTSSSTSASTSAVETVRSVSKENEEVLESQNEELAEEYKKGVWAHITPTPEVGGLVVRLPLEVEMYRNFKHSLMGRKLQKQLKSEMLSDGLSSKRIRISKWYNKAQMLVESKMKVIAESADETGQIDATALEDDTREMLSLFLDNQENWQEVCLIVQKDKTLVLNRPMALQLTENLGRLVLWGSYMAKSSSILSKASSSSSPSKRDLLSEKDLLRFMLAFGQECAVYVGGPNRQDQPATMIHGIADLPGAVEISPGTNIYMGGINAAVQGVLDGKYNPLDFRFFVGCHEYKSSMLNVNVHLGKYQPVACARSLVLKQCISLPKPLWHEVLELCGGEMAAISGLEMMKRDDLQFQVLDGDNDDFELRDELENFDDEDDIMF